MKINKVQYDEGDGSIPVCMLKTEKSFNRWINRLNETVRPLYDTVFEHGGSSKVLFKKAFGRQQITKVYSTRQWIWTFTSGSTTVTCLVGTGGVSWECRKDADPEKVMRLIGLIVMHCQLQMI